MRITTKVIQNNALSNININKILQDKLNNQMSTEKKINRPSDDPVIAIRALRLRTNVSQVTQYYEKNVPDAQSWMKITEDALTTVSSVVTDMIEQCQKGANEKLTSTDRQTILDALTQLKEEVFATGNADYAGRCVFTGFRTDDTLKFTADQKKTYSITEQLDNTAIDQITHIESGNINSINDTNFNTGTIKDITEQNVNSSSVYRMRLSYANVDGELPIISTYDSATNSFKEITKSDGTPITKSVKSENDSPSPYLGIDDDGIVLVKETGELLMGKNIYDRLMQTNDNPTTPVDESEIRLTYQKSNWEKDDLKPEHYFACADTKSKEIVTFSNSNVDSDKVYKLNRSVSTLFDLKLNYTSLGGTAEEIIPTLVDEFPKTGNIDPNKAYLKAGTNELIFGSNIAQGSNYDFSYTTGTTDYNADYLKGIKDKQSIEYDVGLNQTIRVNTTADEVFQHAIGRDVDDMIAAMQETIDMENSVSKINKLVKSGKYSGDDLKYLNNQLDAANKSLTYLKEKTQKMFEGGIAKMQGHLDTVNYATTNCGTRSKKLELIENRLMSQKTNFETLQSDNENADLTEVAIKLSGAELTYQAALMATGKIMQTSLMNYI